MVHSVNNGGHQQLERMTFFSDAVFAIAMTLLVIEVRVPEIHVHSDLALGQALLDLLPKYIGFVVSFMVVGRFWVGHHAVMGLLKGLDRRLVWINRKAGSRGLVRMVGQGLPARAGHGQGHLFLRLSPQADTIDSAARTLLRRFAAAWAA